MLQTPPEDQLNGKTISLLLLVAAFSIPILLPKFAGHRSVWLLFTVAVAAFAFLVTYVFTWLEKRISTLNWRVSENHKIAGAVVGLVGSSVAIVLSSPLFALPSDVVFIVALIIFLFALWIAYRSARTLFRSINERIPKLAVWIAPLIFALGLALQLTFVHRKGNILPLVVCSLIASGCTGAPLPTNPKPD
jgi:hypothetical protein